jgi:hypothetical protein
MNINKTEIEARALVLKFMHPIDKLHKYPMCFDTAKQCALIAVDEIIQEHLFDGSNSYVEKRIDYLIEIIKVIEKL